MKKFFALALLAAVAFVGCNPDDPENGGGTLAPVLTLLTESLDVEATGGNAEVAYSVENPVEGVSVVASVEESVDWISAFDYSVEGKVSFTVAENTLTEAREAVITIAYEGAESKTVSVKQAADNGGETSAPVLTLLTESLDVEATGGSAEVAYSVENPIEGVSVVASVEESVDWISAFDYSVEGKVSFTVAENTLTEAREAVVTVAYEGAESKTVSVKQAAAEILNVEYALNEVSGIYYGNQYSASEDVFNYGLVLSNQSNVYDLMTGAVTILPNSQYLFLDLYSSVASPNHSVTFKMPNGVYNLDLENSTAANTAGYEYTNMYVTNETEGVETFFKSGTVTVTDDLIEAVLVGEDDKTYHITAPNKLVDNTNNWGNGSWTGEFSTLTGDLQVPFADAEANELYAENYGDYLCVGKNMWLVYVDDYATGDEFMLFIHADVSKSAPIGTFPILADVSKEATLTGYIDSDGSTKGSFYYKLDENFEVVGFAPLKSGTVTISVNEEGVATAQVEAKDDKGNSLSGTCVTANVYVDDPYAPSTFSAVPKMVKRGHKVSLAPRAKVKPTMVLKK